MMNDKLKAGDLVSYLPPKRKKAIEGIVAWDERLIHETETSCEFREVFLKGRPGPCNAEFCTKLKVKTPTAD